MAPNFECLEYFMIGIYLDPGAPAVSTVIGPEARPGADAVSSIRPEAAEAEVARRMATHWPW